MSRRERAPEWSLAIIGAGVVGCALAQALASRRDLDPSRIIVLEAAAREGTGTSARNSGVVHAGLYYAPGSRKARTCVAGKALLWDWVRAHGVGHRQTGKLVVAVGSPGSETGSETGSEALAALQDNAARCGVSLEAVTLARARALEPALPSTVQGALWSPSSGIVDAHGLLRSLLASAIDRGLTFVPSASVTAIDRHAAGFELHTSRGPIFSEGLINAAGLHATTIAGWLGVERPLFPARGDYFRLRNQHHQRRGHPPWTRLIYPVMTPGSPSLGIHLTLELDGGTRLGPDLEWLPAEQREDYGPARGEAKHALFLAAARRLLGDLDEQDLVYDGCGIRPKLVGPGQATADFELIESPPGAWHLLGIESPGLTACMALARELSALYGA